MCMEITYKTRCICEALSFRHATMETAFVGMATNIPNHFDDALLLHYFNYSSDGGQSY